MVKVKEEVRGEGEEGSKTGHHIHYHWSYPNQAPGGQQPQPPPTPAPIHFGLGFEPQTSPHQHVVYFHVNPGVSFSFQMADTIQVIKGPVTVPMVSTSSSPPIAMPVQVPHGHVVQQIVDESGTLRHVILSPQHHPPMVPIPQHYSGGSGSATNGAQGFYPGPMPPHGFGPFSPMQPGVIPQHPQGHSPPPMNFHKDERTQRQYNKLKRKLEQKQMRDNPVTTSPPLSPRKELNGNVRKGVGSVGTSEDGEESSSLQDEEEDTNAMLIHLLSSIKAPQVSEVTSRTALVQWSPPAVEQPQDLRYEVLLSDRGKEGKYKSIYTGEALSCRIEDLRPGTEYSVCVSARLDEPNVGRPSEPEVLITPACKPDAPQPPKLSSRSRNALTLKWPAAADNGAHIDHYIVEWEVNGQWTEVAKTKSKQAHIAKLQPATPFKFRVAAVNQFGKSDFSPAVLYETCDSPPPQPSPPSLFHSTPNSLTLHWVARPQDDDFTLQMEEPDSKHGFLAMYNGKETSHTCTSLKKNTCYKFRLKSQNEEGPSRWSEEVRYSTIPGKPAAPSRPQLKGKMHPYSFRLRWEPPSDKGGAAISSYNVQIMPYNNQTEFHTIYSGVTSTCSIEKLTPGTVYQVRVNCEGPGGISDFSEPGIFATEPICPSQCEAPKLSGKPRPHSIPLKWSYPSNDGGSEITELELAMKDCTTDSKELRTAYKGQETETIISDLIPATTYKFMVRATNKVGNGPWSEELEVVSGCGVPSRPEAPSLSTTPSGSVHATWVPPQSNGSPITQYNLQMTTSPCEIFTQVYSGNSSQADVKPVPPATLCFFRLQANNSIGLSDWSELSSVVTAPGVPGAVPGLKATANPTSLEISWSAPPSNGDAISHYTVEAGDTTTSVTEPPCLVENLIPQTSYRIRVKAVNSVGSGQASTLKVSTLALPPRPPTLACTTASHNYLKLKWGSNPNNHHYTVYMTSPNNRRSVVYEGTNSSCKVSRLHEQTDYVFTIVAANSTGKGPESEPTTYSTVIAPPPPIKGLKVTEVGHKNCQVEWSPLRPMSSDSLEYIVQCARLRQQTYKQVYRGVDTRCQVKDLEPGADYLIRVGAVRLCGEVRPSVDGAFSLPATLSTPPVHHENSTPTHIPRHNNQPATSRAALTDNQWAGIILCCFAVIAVFVAIMVANIVY